jgi:hypothetical protein
VAGEIFGLIFFQPQNLGRGVTRHHRITGSLDQRICVSEGAVQFLGLFGG